jgi:sulfate transport system substrate-binding protein
LTTPLSRRAALIGGAGLATSLGALALRGGAAADAKPVTMLNVSYDPTRELYKAYNALFAPDWKRRTGQDVTIQQSHGGSGKQALSVINGLQADVVTLGLAGDIDEIAAKAQLLPANWQGRLPDDSAPYTSTIVFLVRKGNPKNIHTWADLARPGMSIITPNPKTSGGARWSYLAVYGWALRQPGGGDAKARAFLAKVYGQVPVLDSGARGSTMTFAQRGLGDVLLSWENEAYLALDELGRDKVEVVTPPSSILAEPPVAVVDKVVDRRGTRAVSDAYLRGLYSDAGQEVIAKNFYRPRNKAVYAKYAAQFPNIPMFTIRDLGGWTKAQQIHFADGGVFDQIYRPRG